MNWLKKDDEDPALKKRRSAESTEKRIMAIIALMFAAGVAYTSVYVLTHHSTADKKDVYYSPITQAERGVKEVYNAGRDENGNTANINKLTPISCYGDNFTNSPDDSTVSYPGVLSVLAQRTVYNVAVNNDGIYEIAARQGGIPALVSPFVIPPNKKPAEVYVTNELGNELKLDFSKNGGLNPCKINGVEGILSVINGKYCFTRMESGTENIVLNLSEVNTRAMDLRQNDICIFFVGDDEIFDTPEKAVEIYKKMVGKLTSENQTYLIIGPVKGDIEMLDKANKALADAFGDKYLDLRSYLLNDAAKALDIKLTEDDAILAKNKIIPYVYFSDNKKAFSTQGADATGTAVYNKLNELGYFADTKEEKENKQK